MYCHNCGTQLPDGAKICNNCGTKQVSGGQKSQNGAGQSGEYHYSYGRQQNGKQVKKDAITKLLGGILAIAVISAIWFFASAKPDKEEPEVSVRAETTQAPETLPPETTRETKPAPPEEGWFSENEKMYYYDNGIRMTGVQWVEDNFYYFNAQGIMQTGTVTDSNGFIYYANDYGVIHTIQYPYLPSHWGEEYFSFGNGGRALVMELDEPMINCTSMKVYIEAEGKNGANENGDWKIHARINGKWKELKKVAFEEPSGIYTINFDTPTTFDAITAYPLKVGNATYSVYMEVQDAVQKFKDADAIEGAFKLS